MNSWIRTSANTWKSNVIESGGNRRPETGTCPTCGKRYVMRKDGCIRRHGKGGDCLIKDQVPREIIPAILMIAGIGEGDS